VAAIDISGLLEKDIIDLAAEVRNDFGERVATIHVKVFWYENTRDDDPH
jgi:hypothetical protein